jgi:hypothetical protein
MLTKSSCIKITIGLEAFWLATVKTVLGRVTFDGATILSITKLSITTFIVIINKMRHSS